jgi:hypothetical protein
LPYQKKKQIKFQILKGELLTSFLFNQPEWRIWYDVM